MYESNAHQDVLAMAKPEHHGKDFFQRKEFRGLLLADYQEAIGEKAFACVDSLNTNTVSQFSHLTAFIESLGKKKLQERFYKGEDGLNLRGSFNKKDNVSVMSGHNHNNLSRQSKSVVRKRPTNAEMSVTENTLNINNSVRHTGSLAFRNNISD